jgi:HD-like signal output (HDOD) protein
VARDPAATARLLQVVNSAALALRRKITDPADAVGQLGIETVKSVVLCMQVFNPHDHPQQAGFSFDALWSHSLSVATVARDLMLRLTRDSRAASEAFTAGLLHDVGRIVLASNLRKEYADVVASAREHRAPLDKEEADRLGVTHAQVGAYLLGMWGMPAHLVEATALHHTPDETHTREFGLLTAVHVADVLAHEAEAAQQDKDDKDDHGVPLPQLNIVYLSALKLPTSVAQWRRDLASDAFVPELRPDPGYAPPPPSPRRHAVARAEENGPASEGTGWLLRFALPVIAIVLLAVCLFSLADRFWTPLDVAANSPPDPGAAVADTAPEGLPAEPAANPEPTVSSPTQEPVPGQTSALATATDSDNVAAAPPAPKPAEPAKPSPRGFDSVRVQAIFYRTNNPIVMINGDMFTCGDRVNDVEVVAIAPSGVTLACGGEQRVFLFK